MYKFLLVSGIAILLFVGYNHFSKKGDKAVESETFGDALEEVKKDVEDGVETIKKIDVVETIEDIEIPNIELPSKKKASGKFNLADYYPEEYGYTDKKRFYTVNYNENCDIPNWTCHLLTREMVVVDKAERYDRFMIDYRIPSKSSKHSDYTHSGFDRGHMVSAEDMDFSKLAMKETFYMSNIAPQTPGLNRGVWKSLEEDIRELAMKKDSCVIITGSLFKSGKRNRIESGVCVPDYYYKIIYVLKTNTQLCYLFPNIEELKKNPDKYKCNLVELEKLY